MICRRTYLWHPLIAIALALLRPLQYITGETVSPPEIVIDATPGHEVNSFDPDQALGTSIDVQPYGLIDKVYAAPMLKEMLSAGWGPITYRNNTELRIAAWHWNENGTWSDAVHKAGYFTGSSEPKDFIRYIESYSLPHRGFSYSGDGASSLMKGGTQSYWKSNPYLTSKFTSESDNLHPQWLVLDFGESKPVNAIRITWENPFARTYQVDLWVGEDAMDKIPLGEWKPFPSGLVTSSQGGRTTLKLANSPVSTRYIRVSMTESSNTCDVHGSSDVRNCVGYAVSSVIVGNLDQNGDFLAAENTSTGKRVAIYTSSVDPWHSAADAAAHGPQHTGFDLFFTSGITNNLPPIIPVALLYGTPDDAAAQVAYIEKRGYKIGWIEIGEEPDGKHMLPEDYGALYLQWATAIHKIDPALKLGGPVFEGVNEDIKVWPDAQGKVSWIGRFVDYLRSHGRIRDLAFMSFEHYPFDPCSIQWSDLYREPQLISHILDVWREDGIPRSVPLMVTESNLSWNLSGPMSQIFSALWLADSIGSFLDAGGTAYYHSPIQPEPVHTTCLGSATWGNFVPDTNYEIKAYTAQYFVARLMNFEWLMHRAGIHELYRASISLKDEAGHVLVTTYPVRRPNGNWGLLLVNRDQKNPHTVQITFTNSKGGRNGFFTGPITTVSFGSDQYLWRERGLNSVPDPDGPPLSTTVTGGPQVSYTLPKASVTVLRGRVDGL